MLVGAFPTNLTHYLDNFFVYVCQLEHRTDGDERFVSGIDYPPFTAGDTMPRGAAHLGSWAPGVARGRGGVRPPSVFFPTTTKASPYPGPLRGR
eukprot:COSAG04_NODE_760_length_10536_cov_15.103564_6_plen_94_part_00